MSQAQHVGWACAPATHAAGTGGARSVNADALAGLLDALPQPLLLISPDAGVRYANRAAGRLLRRGDGLLVRAGRLAAATAAEGARLRRAIAALWAADGDGRALLALRSSAYRPPLAVLLWRLDRPPGGEPLAAVFAAADSASVHLDQPLLRRLHGLTAAEARLAGLIAAGYTLTEIATRLRIGRSTARTHLQRVLAKTGARRQAALARLLLSGPASLCLPGRDAQDE